MRPGGLCRSEVCRRCGHSPRWRHRARATCDRAGSGNVELSVRLRQSRRNAESGRRTRGTRGVRAHSFGGLGNRHLLHARQAVSCLASTTRRCWAAFSLPGDETLASRVFPIDDLPQYGIRTGPADCRGLARRPTHARGGGLKSTAPRPEFRVRGSRLTRSEPAPVGPPTVR